MSENTVKMAVCNEKDCPLHPSNEFRIDIENQIPNLIESFGNKPMDLNSLKKIHEALMLQYEYKSIPSLCSFCTLKQGTNMKAEVISLIAKRNLIDE